MRNVPVPAADRPIGQRTINIPTLPNRPVTACKCSVSRESLPQGIDYVRPSDGAILPNSAFIITVEVTRPNGVVWVPYIGVFQGGTRLNRDGSVALFTSPFVPFSLNGELVAVEGDFRMIFEALIPMRCSLDAKVYEPGDIDVRQLRGLVR